MELRWTKEAATDLEHIADYLLEKTTERAAGIGTRNL
jgi:plasmid stabilization system protein ParE